MEINLKSSVGKRFSACLDPITVKHLLSLASSVGGDQVYQSVSADLAERASAQHEMALSVETSTVVDSIADKFRRVPDIYAHTAIDAYRAFVSEYELLQEGSGSERACMESFMTLCELLQDA